MRLRLRAAIMSLARRPAARLRSATRARLAGGVALAALLAVASPTFAASRVALVIGNATYESLPSLKNAGNDSKAVADVLKATGFEVHSGADLTRLRFDEVVRGFLRAANDAEIALVYYSGHGVQVGGRNFLVPTDATLSTPYDIEQQTIDVADIHAHLSQHAKAQLIFLDACRDNPFKIDRFWIADSLKTVSLTRGLARVSDISAESVVGPGGTTRAIGSLIAYSTEPGNVALDGTGELSPYTSAFVRHAPTANLEIRQVLTQVRRDVIAATDGKQVPWENSSLIDNVYLFRAPPPPVVTPMLKVEASAGEAAPLDLPTPRQTGGAGLRIRIDRAPETGALVLAGRKLTSGDIVSAREFETLVYDPQGAAPGAIELIGYAALDAFGQSTQGVAAIAVGAGEAGKARLARARAEDEQRRAAAAAWLRSYDGQVRVAMIGRSATPLGLTAPQGAALISQDLEIAATPDFGRVLVGERPVAAGQRIALAEVPQLAFQAPIGSERRSGRITLKAPGTQVVAALEVKPTLDPCDAEAAAPLDLQGVAGGKLPNEIQPAALAACRAATARAPEINRFHYQLGRALLADRKPAEARKAIDEAAGRRHLRAIWEQGNFLALGAFGKPDLAAAAERYRSCAIGGDPYCLFSWGKALFYGQGVAQDVKRGLELMLRSAELGHTYAMNELGFIFTYGRNMPKDVERGLRFYESGAARTDIYSYNNLGLVYLRGAGRDADAAKALDFFRKAAEGGHPYAPTNIGRIYRDGTGVAADRQEAARWLALGGERGDYWGALDRGRLATDDGAEAARWLGLAVWLNRLRDNTDPDRQAEKLLAGLNAADKRKAVARLEADLGAEAKAVKAPGLEQRLAALAERDWKRRNPRYDLF